MKRVVRAWLKANHPDSRRVTLAEWDDCGTGCDLVYVLGSKAPDHLPAAEPEEDRRKRLLEINPDLDPVIREILFDRNRRYNAVYWWARAQGVLMQMSEDCQDIADQSGKGKPLEGFGTGDFFKDWSLDLFRVAEQMAKVPFTFGPLVPHSSLPTGGKGGA
jgi:hypothetical protein